MTTQLNHILAAIGDTYKDKVTRSSRHYLAVNIGDAARELGYPHEAEQYRHAHAVVPLKQPVPGMKVRIDGRTFINYAQLESGVAVAEYVAKQTGLPYSHYQANDSMICNFA